MELMLLLIGFFFIGTLRVTWEKLPRPVYLPVRADSTGAPLVRRQFLLTQQAVGLRARCGSRSPSFNSPPLGGGVPYRAQWRPWLTSYWQWGRSGF
jgi:hypothetical protein